MLVQVFKKTDWDTTSEYEFDETDKSDGSNQ